MSKSIVKFENGPLPDVVELININHSYDGGKTWTIKDLNLLIEAEPNKGQFVSILGRSGSGKSSILRMLAGLMKPTSGEVLIKAEPRRDKHRIGMVFQKYSSLPWYTVSQNVALGLRFTGDGKNNTKERIREVIDIVGLTGKENNYTEQLSGGQLQRVAIARSLISNPEILLMDEPFGALDINTRVGMQEFLLKIWDRYKNTIIFVTHDISEAVFLSDEIWIMDSNPGCIVDRIILKDELPTKRTKDMKRSPAFVDLVYNVEDKMLALEKGNKK